MPGSFFTSNIIKTLVLLAAAVLCILFFGGLIADALGLLFGAGLICFLLSPVAAFFERKLRRAPAVILTLFLAAALLVALPVLLAPLLARQFGELIDVLPLTLQRLSHLVSRLADGLRAAFPHAGIADQFSLPGAVSSLSPEGIGTLAKTALEAVGGMAGFIYRLALATILGCFFMIDREKILLRLELLLPMKWRRNGVRLGKTLLRELRLYLRGQATVSLAVGALTALGFTLTGLEGGVLLGLFVGICNIIPYFGPLIGGIPAVLTALGSGWQSAALTAGIVFLVQQIDGMLLSPRIMGNITGFSPSVVLLALFLASQSGGVIGLLIATPLLMTARTLYRVLVQSRLPETGAPVQSAE